MEVLEALLEQISNKEVIEHKTKLEGKLKLIPGSLKVDEDTGDVSGRCIALDTKKDPNRKGFTFKWASPSDVNVQPLIDNGRMYWMHNTWSPGVGFITGIKVTMKQVLIDFTIPGDSRFPEELQDSYYLQFLREIRGLVQTGMIKAVSVGFYIHGYTERQDSKTQRSWLEVNKLEIIENSFVTIGAHETALIQSVPIGTTLTSEFTDDMAWAEEQMQEPVGEPAVGGMAIVNQYQRKGELITMGIDAPSTKAIMDAGEAESFAERVATHHQGTAVDIKQLKTAMGRTLGARGGIDGTTSVECAVIFSHLSEHYKELGLDIPEFKIYTKDELNQMHADGVIVIPGNQRSSATVELNLDTENFNEVTGQFITKLETVLLRLEDVMNRAECLKIEQDSESELDTTPAPTAEIKLDTDALRKMIRGTLESDPDMQKLRENRTAIALHNFKNKKR